MLWLRGFVLVLFAALAAPLAQAADFRIENRVYVEDAAEPTTTSVTVFTGGLIYDFISQPPRVTVFDPAADRFVLLDTTRRVRTAIETGQLDAENRRMQAAAAASDKPLLAFFARPQFDELFDAATGELRMTSPLVKYHLKTIPAPQAEVVGQFQDFSDWYAQLNTLAAQGALPYGRMLVDQALSRRGRLPVAVYLQIAREEGPPIKLRSEHRYGWELNQEDVVRVQATARDIAEFDPVEFINYRRLVLEDAATGQKKLR